MNEILLGSQILFDRLNRRFAKEQLGWSSFPPGFGIVWRRDIENGYNSIGETPYLFPRVDPWAFLAIPRTYFRANIPNAEWRFCVGVQPDDVRDRGRVPCCDSLGVRREAKKAGEAVRCEHDRFDLVASIKKEGAVRGGRARFRVRRLSNKPLEQLRLPIADSLYKSSLNSDLPANVEWKPNTAKTATINSMRMEAPVAGAERSAVSGSAMSTLKV